MTVFGANDMISTNLLTELHLNPVWEQWRGYFLTGSIVCSLIPFHMTLNGIELHCVPKQIFEDFQIFSETVVMNVSSNQITYCNNITNASSVNYDDCKQVVPLKLCASAISKIKREKLRCKAKLTSSETNYINARCATQGNLFILRYSGAIMLGTVVIIILVSSSWLHIESVKDDIRKFGDAIRSLPRIDLPRDDMKRLCAESFAKPAEDADKSIVHRNEIQSLQLKAVRGIIRVLTSNDFNEMLFTWYIRRSIALSCFIIFLIPILVYIAWKFGHWQNSVTCTHTIRDSEYVEFHCTVNSAHTISGFICVFGVTLLLQTLVFLHPYFKWKSVLGKEFHSRSVRLLAMFWNSSVPENSGLFRDIAGYIMTQEYKEELAKNMMRILEDEDLELLRIAKKLFGNAPGALVATYEIFIRNPPHSNLNMFLEFMKAGMSLPLTEESQVRVIELINRMKMHQQISNELLVILLESCGTERIQDIVKLIDLSRIEDKTINGEERRSILFYAFTRERRYGPNGLAVAKALCRDKSISNLKIKRIKNAKTYEQSLQAFLFEIYKTKQDVNYIVNECWPENDDAAYATTSY